MIVFCPLLGRVEIRSPDDDEDELELELDDDELELEEELELDEELELEDELDDEELELLEDELELLGAGAGPGPGAPQPANSAADNTADNGRPITLAPNPECKNLLMVSYPIQLIVIMRSSITSEANRRPRRRTANLA